MHENILDAAVEHDCRSVAVPAISTGAYRFPIDRAASIAVTAAVEFLKKTGKLDVVRFVLFKQAQFDAFQQVLEEALP